MRLSVLLHDDPCRPIVPRIYKRRSIMVGLSTRISTVSVLWLLLMGLTAEYNPGWKIKPQCFLLAHAWQSQLLSRQSYNLLAFHYGYRKEKRFESLLKLLAYTEETGPGSGGSGYGNQTQPLNPNTALRNGKSHSTTLSKLLPPTTSKSVSFPPDMGTLGDIMSSTLTSLGDDEGEEPVLPASLPLRYHHPGLVTSSSRNETLAAKFGIIHPLDRMALTANGNLQRLFSSYYDAPVHVQVDFCQARDTDGIVWDRVVHLNVHQQTFCTATSVITVNDETCRKLVQSGQVGLGQLFRFLDLLPQFDLQQAGQHANGGWWRVYELKCRQVHCHIREDFCEHLWDIAAR